MLTPVSLRDKLAQLSGRGYAAYQAICGDYDFGHFLLCIDHVQRDRFASPTRMRVRVSQRVADFPERFLGTPVASRATADWIAREVSALIVQRLEGRAAGSLWVDEVGQAIALRTSVAVRDGAIELRLNASFSPQGRVVSPESVQRVLFAELPAITRETMMFDGLRSDSLRAHVEAAEDQVALRDALPAQGLVAFVSDGTQIRSTTAGEAAPEQAASWKAPRGLAVTMRAPHRGKLRGLGIPRGVTLITGAPLQGKSTFLRRLLDGTRDSVPGAGGGLVVTDPSALAVCAEEGRSVTAVDLASLLPGLTVPGPEGRTFAYATGAIAQAAGVVEALEMGSRVLLVDEDRSVPWLLVSDERLPGRLGPAPRTVVPLISWLPALAAERGVSVVIATSVFSQFLDIADTVIVFEDHAPVSATTQSRRGAPPAGPAGETPWGTRPRHVLVVPSDFGAEGKVAKAVARGDGVVAVGTREVDLSAIGSLTEPSRLRGVGVALDYIARSGIADGTRSMAEVVAEVGRRIEADGLDVISPHVGRHPGDYAEFRPIELAAALNRLRCLRVVPAPERPPAEEADAHAAEAAGKPRRSRRRGGRRRGGGAPAGAEPQPEPQPEPEPPPAAPPEPAAPAAQPAQPKPSRSRRRPSRVAKVVEPAAAPTPTPAPEPAAAPAGPRPSRSRRRPSRAAKVAEPPAAPIPTPAPEPAAPPAGPKPSHSRRRPSRAAKVIEPPAAPIPTPAPEPATPPAGPKPSRSRRRPSRAAKVVEPTAVATPTPAPEPATPTPAPSDGAPTTERVGKRRRRRPRRAAGAKTAAATE